MTHDELVERASKWLQQKHSVVITELTTYAGEQPDAIGFNYYGEVIASSLIECKASRADFKSDEKKQFRRQSEWGMGCMRYYMCPPDLIAIGEVPQGWGLLYVYKTQVRAVLIGRRFDTKGFHAEMALLVSAIRRIGQRPPEGLKIKAYHYNPHESMLKASIGVLKEPSDSDCY